MKTKLFILFVLIFVSCRVVYSQDIEKAWGISAGLYQNQVNEIAVSYGVSNRTSILFFTNLNYSNNNTDTEQSGAYVTSQTVNNDELSASIGSELRGYFYTNRVAPFGGIRFSIGGNNNKHEKSGSDWTKNRRIQINIGLTYGAEYFIKNTLSVYISMSLFEYSLTRQINEIYDHQENLITEATSQIHKVRITQNPAVFLKIYF
jgi:hypothetical protein